MLAILYYNKPLTLIKINEKGYYLQLLNKLKAKYKLERYIISLGV